MTFTGITQARARLERLAQGLREAAGGAVLARAAAKVQAQIDAVASAKAGAHQDTGAAASSVLVTASGGLVQLNSAGYLKFHGWWPFRRGIMPPFIVKNASQILARELLTAIGATSVIGAEAAALVADDETAKAKRAGKRKKARRG